MRSWLRVDAVAGRLPRWQSEGVFTVRLTGKDQVHIVSAAAGPLGGDEVAVQVRVGSGASLTVRGVAASVALPGLATDRSSWSWELDVAEGGRLHLEPQPVIVAGRAAHHGATVLRLAEGAAAVLVEQAQIGRFGEADGTWRGSLAVDVGGEEILRHTVELGEGGATWDRFFAPAAMESEFRYPDDRPAWTGAPEEARTARCAQDKGGVQPVWEARMPLAGGGSLTTRLSSRLVDM